VRREKRRLRQLENEVAQAKADQADLQRRLELFEKIAAAAGVEDAGPAAERAEDDTVPQSLVVAAQDPRQGGAPVRVDVDGRELVAVVGGGGGDPHEWWNAIRHLASRLRSA
jgi:hypothetical protein